nr:MAG TPA: hypothetical protein [Caudoviricetes sp.]
MPDIFVHFPILTFRRAASVRRGPNFCLFGSFNNYMAKSLCNLPRIFLPKSLDIPLWVWYIILVQRDRPQKEFERK